MECGVSLTPVLLMLTGRSHSGEQSGWDPGQTRLLPPELREGPRHQLLLQVPPQREKLSFIQIDLTSFKRLTTREQEQKSAALVTETFILSGTFRLRKDRGKEGRKLVRKDRW